MEEKKPSELVSTLVESLSESAPSDWDLYCERYSRLCDYLYRLEHPEEPEETRGEIFHTSRRARQLAMEIFTLLETPFVAGPEFTEEQLERMHAYLARHEGTESE